MNKDILIFFSDLIERELGIIYSESNYFQLENRLEDISKTLKLDNVQELYEKSKLGLDNEVKQLLIDISTNNETSFFRDHKIFLALESILEKRILSGKKDNITFWSAASSSGQEAISISLIVNELFDKLGVEVPYSIMATDISDRILEKARKGIYSDLEVSRGLGNDLKDKYFDEAGPGNWSVKQNILNKIDYKTFNLKSEFTFEKSFDFIFCRNVLIYQAVESKISILDNITKSLTSDGLLFLGAGESLIGLTKDYDQVSLAGAVIYQKK